MFVTINRGVLKIIILAKLMKLCVKKNRKNKQLFIGRRFGKTGMLYHTIVDSLSISTETKKELHDQYEKALRGEE